MSESLVVRPKASQQLASLIGMDPAAMLDTIKAQCFKTNPANVTNEQLAAFVSIAAEMQVNPLLPGMLYAYPIQGGGIIPIMGPDGIYKKLSERDDIVSWETEVLPADVSMPPTHAITRIWRKDRDKPISYTALLSEWKINSNPNWNTRPRHMLALRSLKHAARQLIHGMPGDEDDRHIMSEINVTPGAEGQAPAPAVDRPAPPKRSPKGAAAVSEAEKGKVIDITSTPAGNTPPAAEEKKVAPAEPPKNVEPPKQEEKKSEPAPDPKSKSADAPRTKLIAEEEFVCTATVKEIFTLLINVSGTPQPSVQANIEGEFEGKVFEFGGATKDAASGDLAPTNPAWKVGGKVKLLLFGRVNKNTQVVMPVVRKVESAEGSPNTAIDVG